MGGPAARQQRAVLRPESGALAGRHLGPTWGTRLLGGRRHRQEHLLELRGPRLVLLFLHEAQLPQVVHVAPRAWRHGVYV